MLTIRLSRRGKSQQIAYRLIISEKARDTYGKSLEILGSYDPNSKKLEAKADRIKYWISKGAGTSTTVNNLLIKNGIIEGKVIKASKYKKIEAKEEDKKEEKPDNKEVKVEETKEEVKEETKAKEEKSAKA
ncbi:30S ribosomal protein S16 [Patescibacteria group bacterium]|nr:30S ribosomal protein S16 [Patescibacteria group bacterium]